MSLDFLDCSQRSPERGNRSLLVSQYGYPHFRIGYLVSRMVYPVLLKKGVPCILNDVPGFCNISICWRNGYPVSPMGYPVSWTEYLVSELSYLFPERGTWYSSQKNQVPFSETRKTFGKQGTPFGKPGTTLQTGYHIMETGYSFHKPGTLLSGNGYLKTWWVYVNVHVLKSVV